jgi:hypothetical protein
MIDRSLWAVLGVLYRVDVAIDARDLPSARKLVRTAMRLLLAELDDIRRRQS